MLVILHRNYAAEKAKRIKRLVTLNRNALHLVEAHLVASAIVELCVRVEAWFAIAAAFRASHRSSDTP
jgi:hypothetical protein